MTTTKTIDWEAAAKVAGELGIQTRQLVWRKDADGARELALQMAAAHSTGSGFNAVRVSSYLELAVLLGYSAPPRKATPADDERLAWIKNELAATDGKIKSLRDTLAQVVTQQDQAKAADKEGEAEMQPEPVDVIDVEPSAELEVYEPRPPSTLYGTADPKIALVKMSELAEALMDVVRSRKLAVRIKGREHLTIEAWTTLGALVGVHGAVSWTRPNESGDGYIARAEARTLAGVLVGAAESECSRTESKWKSSQAYAIRSMAQTRALSRALQAPLRHIAVLAGYEGTAAEEMPGDDEPDPPPAPTTSKIPAEHQPTREQRDELAALIRTLEGADAGTDWKARCREILGAPWEMATKTTAEIVIDKLRAELKTLNEVGE